jgi:hypothetical protein
MSHLNSKTGRIRSDIRPTMTSTSIYHRSTPLHRRFVRRFAFQSFKSKQLQHICPTSTVRVSGGGSRVAASPVHPMRQQLTVGVVQRASVTVGTTIDPIGERTGTSSGPKEWREHPRKESTNTHSPRTFRRAHVRQPGQALHRRTAARIIQYRSYRHNVYVEEEADGDEARSRLGRERRDPSSARAVQPVQPVQHSGCVLSKTTPQQRLLFCRYIYAGRDGTGRDDATGGFEREEEAHGAAASAEASNQNDGTSTPTGRNLQRTALPLPTHWQSHTASSHSQQERETIERRETRCRLCCDQGTSRRRPSSEPGD